MPEEKITIEDEKINTFQEVEDKLIEESGIPSMVLPLAKSLPPTSERNIHKGSGGRYLEQDTSTDGFSTVSSTFVDVTGMSITANIRHRRVLLMFSGQIATSVAGERVALTFDIDGTNQGNLVESTLGAASPADFLHASMFFITDVLIGSHTFKVQAHSSGGATAYVGTYNTNKMVFSAVELS